MSSTFRLRFGEHGYPISRLVFDRARALGLSRSDLARRLAYRPIGNAHRALGEALRTGTVPAHMRKHLADALELDEAVIDSIIEATSDQRQDKWRARLLRRGKGSTSPISSRSFASKRRKFFRSRFSSRP